MTASLYSAAKECLLQSKYKTTNTNKKLKKKSYITNSEAPIFRAYRRKKKLTYLVVVVVVVVVVVHCIVFFFPIITSSRLSTAISVPRS